ncbi:MAG: hypothetical protein ABSG75_05610 [Syntrophales bacterium]|jgi:hypothetical protein
MLITCPAAFFFQDITDATYALALALALPELALPELVPQVLQVLQVLQVPQVLRVLQVLQVPGPPLLSWRAQAVSFLVLMGSPLM